MRAVEPLQWPEPLPSAELVRLRPWAATDLALVEELSADPYVPLIGTVPVPYSAAAGLAYVARQHQRLTDGVGWSFAVEERASGRAVGGAGLWLHEDRPPSVGYVIAASARGRGLATPALRALTDFAWTLPGVRRVELFIEPDNEASVRTAERCGYALEARLPAHLEIGGRLRDLLRYAQAPPHS